MPGGSVNYGPARQHKAAPFVSFVPFVVHHRLGPAAALTRRAPSAI